MKYLSYLEVGSMSILIVLFWTSCIYAMSFSEQSFSCNWNHFCSYYLLPSIAVDDGCGFCVVFDFEQEQGVHASTCSWTEISQVLVSLD